MSKQLKTEYDLQAEKFIADTNTTITKTYTGHRLYFDGDKEKRACFHITVSRDKQSFSYDFGQSIVGSYKAANSEGRYFMAQGNFAVYCADLHRYGIIETKTPPSDYSLLSCMASDSYESDSFDNWCSNCGYDSDSRKTLDLYLKCEKIASDINRFFTDAELDPLREIQ